MEAAAELESSNDKEKIREKRDKERQKERAKVERDKENDDETIKVYDGYGALRKRLFRTVTVHKMCSRDELLLAAMRAYMVTQDSRNFYLLDVYANGGEGDRDEELEDPTPVMVNYFRGFNLKSLKKELVMVKCYYIINRDKYYVYLRFH